MTLEMTLAAKNFPVSLREHRGSTLENDSPRNPPRTNRWPLHDEAGLISENLRKRTGFDGDRTRKVGLSPGVTELPRLRPANERFSRVSDGSGLPGQVRGGPRGGWRRAAESLLAEVVLQIVLRVDGVA